MPSVLFKNISRFVLHAERLRRLFPFYLPVKAVGYIPKNSWTCRELVHPTLNFCVLLAPRGEMIEVACNGTKCSARVPCLHVNIPGKVYANRRACEVMELYFSYDAALMPAFRRVFSDLDAPVRRFALTPQVRRLLAGILALTRHIHQPDAVDRLDLFCYQMIFEIMLAGALPACRAGMDDVIRKIASRLEIAYAMPISWPELLREYGISYRSFIRHWQRVFNVTPVQFVNRLRIAEAQRLFADTGMTVKEVAAQVGMEDVYYFSRLFKRIAGQSPRAYRKKKFSV